MILTINRKQVKLNNIKVMPSYMPSLLAGMLKQQLYLSTWTIDTCRNLPPRLPLSHFVKSEMRFTFVMLIESNQL
jgi:hypothetical protein